MGFFGQVCHFSVPRLYSRRLFYIEKKSHTLRTCANKKPPMRHASKAQIVHLSKFHVP